jgi:predicted enzyme related to lactoylglutathione lyase
MLPLTAVVYAKDARRLADFYAQLLALPGIESGDSFVRMGTAALELTIVQAPPALAATIVIAQPPPVREETPIKLSFGVPDIEALRPWVERLGGGLQSPDAAWSWRGATHLDGWDAEGNVFQLRQLAA